jgi:hypothetical protein
MPVIDASISDTDIKKIIEFLWIEESNQSTKETGGY